MANYTPYITNNIQNITYIQTNFNIYNSVEYNPVRIDHRLSIFYYDEDLTEESDEYIDLPETELSKKYDSDEEFKNFIDQNYPEIICPISHQIMNEPMITKCGHTFDSICLDKWMEDNDNCPMCREDLSQSDINKNEEITKKIKELN